MAGLRWRGTIMMVCAMFLMLISISWTLIAWWQPGEQLSTTGIILFVISCLLFLVGIPCAIPELKPVAVHDSKSDAEHPSTILIVQTTLPLNTEDKTSAGNISVLPESVVVDSNITETPPPYSEHDRNFEYPPSYESLQSETRQLLVQESK